MAKFCESLIILPSMQMKMEMVISPGGEKKKKIVNFVTLSFLSRSPPVDLSEL